MQLQTYWIAPCTNVVLQSSIKAQELCFLRADTSQSLRLTVMHRCSAFSTRLHACVLYSSALQCTDFNYASGKALKSCHQNLIFYKRKMQGITCSKRDIIKLATKNTCCSAEDCIIIDALSLEHFAFAGVSATTDHQKQTASTHLSAALFPGCIAQCEQR